jgi:hypothetical protein
MSEVLSLREQVAQAELAVRAIETKPNQHREVVRPEKEISLPSFRKVIHETD